MPVVLRPLFIMMQVRKTYAGFSTPEVLLSIFVVAIGMVTIMTVMSSALRYSYSNQDIIIGTDLAQEGIELVRNVRDNDFASGGTGFALFSNQRHCRIDWDDASTTLDCQGGQGTVSRYNLNYTNGLYSHVGAGVATGRYNRYIFINYDSNGGDRALVRSFVFWGDGSLPPNNGDPSSCTTVNSCVFSETFFTAWK